MASDPIEELGKRWPQSQVTTFTAEHDWTVGPFPAVSEQSTGTGESNDWKEIKSAKFAADGNGGGGHNLQFQMALQFDRSRINDKESLFLKLYCSPGKEVASEVPVSFEVTFDDGSDDSKLFYTTSQTFPDDDFLFPTMFTDFNFGDRTTLNRIETLTVSVKLSGAYIKATAFFLSQMELLNSGTLSDFTVVVGDGDKEEQQQQQIPVHRERLAACSPVFAAMFRHEDTREVQESQVVITDVHPDVFKDFLQFVYTGVKPKCASLTTDLLTLADKYQVKELREHCEEYLSASLSVCNVVYYLRVAHLHSAFVLKKSCLKFMAANFADVVSTYDWEVFCKGGNSGQLMLEVAWATAEYIQSLEAEKKENNWYGISSFTNTSALC